MSTTEKVACIISGIMGGLLGSGVTSLILHNDLRFLPIGVIIGIATGMIVIWISDKAK